MGPGEWHWQTSPPFRDAPFFGYTAKRGYNNARKIAHSKHARLHTRSQPLEFHDLLSDHESLAQRLPKEGGHAHLADPQLGFPGWHLALVHGDPSPIQSM